MAPKKRPPKNDDSSSSKNFDPSKFISKEAFERYEKLEKLKFIKERGFAKPNVMLRREVVIKRWIELCKHPEVALAPVFREFLANLCGEQERKVFVKGHWVSFDRKVMNEHYNLSEDNYEQFKSLFNNPNYDVILKRLTDNKVQ